MSWPQTSLEAVATARSYDDPPPRDFESIELSCDTVNSFVICCLFDLGFSNFGLLCYDLKPSSRMMQLLEATMYLDVLWGQPIKLVQVASTSELHENQ